MRVDRVRRNACSSNVARIYRTVACSDSCHPCSNRLDSLRFLGARRLRIPEARVKKDERMMKRVKRLPGPGSIVHDTIFGYTWPRCRSPNAVSPVAMENYLGALYVGASPASSFFHSRQTGSVRPIDSHVFSKLTPIFCFHPFHLSRSCRCHR